MTVPNVSHLPSIQGEPYQKPAPEPLTVQEVDSYVDSHSEGVVDCRSGGHTFPRPRPGVMVEFDDVTPDGDFIVHYLCRSCGCAVRREVWIAVVVKRGKEWRYERVDKTLIYQKNDQGETYLLPPGTGRARRAQFEESLMTRAMKGQSPSAIRKALQRNRSS